MLWMLGIAGAMVGIGWMMNHNNQNLEDKELLASYEE